jgi:recombination protein RecA
MSNKTVLDQTVKLLQKKFGTTSALRLGSGREAAAQVKEVIPTGVEIIDHYSIGIGGLPVGRMSELSGEEGAGKTALSWQCIASAQQHGATCVVVDVEYSFDEDRAKVYGVDIDNLIIVQPETMEMALEQSKLLLTSHNAKRGPLLLVWDTIAAMTPKVELGKEAGDRAPALQSMLMSAELKKLIPLLAKHRAHLLALNQVRANFGVMFGPNTITPGGKAVKFYASLRLQLFGGKAIKNKADEHTGKIVTLVTAKTRFSPPFRKARIRLDYDTGWNNEWSTLEHAKKVGKAGRGAKGDKAHQAALVSLGWGGVVSSAEAKASGEEE